MPTSSSTDFAMSMRPDYHLAIIDTIEHYGWKDIIYMYDSHDGKHGDEMLVVTSCEAWGGGMR